MEALTPGVLTKAPYALVEPLFQAKSLLEVPELIHDLFLCAGNARNALDSAADFWLSLTDSLSSTSEDLQWWLEESGHYFEVVWVVKALESVV